MCIVSGNFDEHFRGGYWLPPYHDMGLISAILFPVYIGGQSFLMAPESFIQRPVRWLEMISRNAVEYTAGPNFAYQLCVDAIDEEQLESLDLSSLKFVWNGAEHVRGTTLRAFADKFAKVGFEWDRFIPCYGMAESVLLSTGTPRETGGIIRQVDSDAIDRKTGPVLGEPIDWMNCDIKDLNNNRIAVSCGKPIPEHAAKIVDQDSYVELEDGEIGEIWLSGPCIARGYWNKTEVTQEIFHARITGDCSPDTDYLRTGDLGCKVDGEVYVFGRCKEMLIIRGQNYYPQDIEMTVPGCDASLSRIRRSRSVSMMGCRNNW